MTNTPSPCGQPPSGQLPTSPCDRIAIIEQALFQLATGEKKAQVRYGNNWVSFHPGSTTWLQNELTRCRCLCADVSKGGNGPRTAIRVLAASAPVSPYPFMNGGRR